MPAADAPTVAAVVPHWNRRDLLETALGSFSHQTRPFDEVIVADNGSTDDSAGFAERAGARVVRLGSNLGFTAAVNRGIEASSADWIAILNNDVTLEPDWLARLLDRAARENAWFACGKILRASDHRIIDGTFDEISRGACAQRCGAGKPDSPAWNQPRAIRFAPMTAAIFRRKLFDEIGLLDETFGSYLEDVDFGIRCAIAGRGGVYVPTAIAYHQGSATLGEWNSRTVRQIARNQVLIAAKHFQGQSKWPIFLGQWLWGLLALRHGQGVAFWAGRRAGIAAAKGIHPRDFNGSPEFEETVSRLRRIFHSSEREILALERQTGFDAYWRAYFCLSRR